MGMSKLQIYLENEELRALTSLAFRELRDPRDQLRIALREHLAARGIRIPEVTHDETQIGLVSKKWTLK